MDLFLGRTSLRPVLIGPLLPGSPVPLPSGDGHPQVASSGAGVARRGLRRRGRLPRRSTSAMKDSVTENAPDMGGIGDKIKAMKDNVADKTSVRQSQFVPRGPPPATALGPRTSVSDLFAFDVAVWQGMTDVAGSVTDGLMTKATSAFMEKFETATAGIKSCARIIMMHPRR